MACKSLHDHIPALTLEELLETEKLEYCKDRKLLASVLLSSLRRDSQTSSGGKAAAE
jgi:hypothetical protein